MIIYNNETHIKGYSGLGVDLLPGNNFVQDEKWEQMQKKYPLIKVDLESGVLKIQEFHSRGQGNERGKKITDFNKLSSTQARKILDETWSIATLQEWRKEESKSDIRNLIDDKIKKILASKNEANIGEKDKK